MIGIDSTAIIDLIKNDESIIKLLSEIDDKIVSTLVNYFEVIIGIDITNPNHKKQKEFFNEIFNTITLFHLDKNSSETSSKIFWELKKSGFYVDNSDLMIVGILLSNGVNKIITRNKKHYEKIPGMKVIAY